MLREKLKKFNVILASGSPRRQHLFKELDIPFTIDIRAVEEVYPKHLKGAQITDYLADLKSKSYIDSIWTTGSQSNIFYSEVMNPDSFLVHSIYEKWNEENYGPIRMPKAGKTISITKKDLPIYKQIIKFGITSFKTNCI